MASLALSGTFKKPADWPFWPSPGLFKNGVTLALRASLAQTRAFKRNRLTRMFCLIWGLFHKNWRRGPTGQIGPTRKFFLKLAEWLYGPVRSFFGPFFRQISSILPDRGKSSIFRKIKNFKTISDNFPLNDFGQFFFWALLGL